MTMIYSNPARENENDGALPDVEVWQHHHTQLGGCQPSVAPSWPCAGAGWYWQAGTSGRTPTFDYSTWTPDPDDTPHGPFDTEAEAVEDARFSAAADMDDYDGATTVGTPNAGPFGRALPQCAIAMGCLCAGHAQGNPASAACDTNETTRVSE